MNAVDVIIQKREGGVLSDGQIRFFIAGVTDGSWSDEQIAALLMACFLQGLSVAETATLTDAMARSGQQLDLSALPGLKVDKHSTGGVADTTTLVLAPLLAACGLPMVKLSGRGLGFTGGTIDKLQAIPGFRVDLSVEEALAQARRNKLVLLSQTGQMTPADRKLYALRDVTGTVDSIPLIASSIMSKKIAAGADVIVLDIKCGSGAFMQTLDQARQLAELMVSIGLALGRKVTAVISRMDQPLGPCIGNSLEVREAIAVLRGKSAGDLLDLVLTLGAEVLLATGQAAGTCQARDHLKAVLADGRALAAFRRFVADQGGDQRIIDQPDRLPRARHQATLLSPGSGHLAAVDTARLGQLFVALGGGRYQQTDTIDASAGICVKARLGDAVKTGQPLATLEAMDQEKLEHVRQQLPACFHLSDTPPQDTPLVLDIIR